MFESECSNTDWANCPQGRSLHSQGQFFPLAAPLDTINIHLRGGHIIPQQVGLHSWRNARALTRKTANLPQHNSPVWFERFLRLQRELLFKGPALTTATSRKNPFFLTVALSAGGQAWGDLFWDDGDSLDTFETGNYSYIVFVADEVW